MHSPAGRITLLLLLLLWFGVCCSFDLFWAIKEGRNTAEVVLEVSATDENVLTSIRAWQQSVKGKQEELTIRNLSDDRKSLRIKSRNEWLFYKSLLIQLDSATRPKLSGLSIRIGDRLVRYTPEEFEVQWPLLQRSPGKAIYRLPDNLRLAPSRLPMVSEVINWKGDGPILQQIVAGRLPVFFLLAVLYYLLAFSNVFRPERRTGYALPLPLFGLFLALFVAYRLPFNLYGISPGLDPSWTTALNWAWSKGRFWGNDVIFTYGPYFWLLCPSILLSQSGILTAFFVNTLVFGTAAGVLLLTVRDLVRQRRLSLGAAVAIVLVLLLIDYEITNLVLAAVVLLLGRAAGEEKSSFLPLGLAVGLLALLSLSKFGYMATSVGMLLIFAIQQLVHRRYATALVAIGGYIGLLILLWTAAGQPLTNIPPYLKYSFQVASYYSENISYEIWNRNASALSNVIDLAMLAGAVLMLLGLGALLIYTLPNQALFWPLAMTTPILFLFFKEGFVRFDRGHYTQFFAQLVILLIVYLLTAAGRQQQLRPLVAYLAVCFLGATLVLTTYHIRPVERLEQAFSRAAREAVLAGQKKGSRDFYRISDADLAQLDPRAVTDIIPWEISLLYAYDLNWEPRPLLQSYTAYAADLDSLDAAHYSGPKAPEQVLYACKALDDRYPLFDEPKLFASLLNHYQVRTRLVGDNATDYLLLTKDSPDRRASDRRATTQRPAPRFHASLPAQLDSSIFIPALKNQHIFMHLDLELTWLGKLLVFFYKIPHPVIEIYTKGERAAKSFRYIRQVGRNGLLVSKYAETNEAVEQIFNERYQPDIERVRLIGNKWFYKQAISVRFSAQFFNTPVR